MTKAERHVWEHVAKSLADDLTHSGIVFADDSEWNWTPATRRAAKGVLKELRARGKAVRRGV